MKTKTEMIRKLLDERGIQYFKRDIGSKCFTAWGKKDVNRATFFESGIETPLHRTYFTAENITAEQAIAMMSKGDCDMESAVSVQECPNELLKSDAVTIMRKSAEGFQGEIGHVIKNAKMLLNMDAEKGLDSVLFERLADMVERDYVRRECYYERTKELGTENAELKKCWAQEHREHMDECEISTRLSIENAELQARINELTAERDELEMRINSLVAELGDAEGTSIILERQRDQLKNAINELQKKQPYCYDPEQPLDTLDTIGRYIDELKSRTESVLHDNHLLTQKFTQKTEQNLIKKSESLNDEADSREKLEEDIWAGCDHLTMMERGDVLVNVPLNRLLGWLDRQAAITKRECLECAAKSDWLGQHLYAVIAENRELQAKLDELNAKLKNDPYDIVSCEHVISSDTLHLILDEWDIHPGWTATNENMAQLFNHAAMTLESEREKELEQLIRDMWKFGENSNYPYTPLESVRWAQMREEYRERIVALEIKEN